MRTVSPMNLGHAVYICHITNTYNPLRLLSIGSHLSQCSGQFVNIIDLNYAGLGAHPELPQPLYEHTKVPFRLEHV